jgi:hypothetical protein
VLDERLRYKKRIVSSRRKGFARLPASQPFFVI